MRKFTLSVMIFEKPMIKNRKIRLYVQSSIEEHKDITLNDDQSHYILNVMRCNQQNQIQIFNCLSGEWLASIKVIRKNVIVTPIKLLKNVTKKPEKLIILCFAPTKKYGEFVVEKATELSVNGIMPILCERSIVNKINLQRYEKTAIEAIEQSQQLCLPHIFSMTHIKDIQKTIQEKYINKSHVFIVCDINSEQVTKVSQLNFSTYDVITIIIGPEGGFGELDKKTLNPFIHLKLGNNVMRAETASIAAVAILNSLIREF